MIKRSKTEMALLSGLGAMLTYFVSHDTKGSHAKTAFITVAGFAALNELAELSGHVMYGSLETEHVTTSLRSVAVKSAAAAAFAYGLSKAVE